MIEVSPFTPLFFGTRKADGFESDYTQIWKLGERMMIQCFSDVKPNALVYIEPSGEVYLPVIFHKYPMSGKTCWLCELRLPEVGCYSIGFNGVKSETIYVTDDDDELADTVLIQYSNRNNYQRGDALFVTDNNAMGYFSWRVHGGFKDSGWSFGAESEQFVSSEGDVVQLYGSDSVVKTLTLGTSTGVPIWYAEMLNRILTLSDVYIDGVRYARNESAVPEIEQIGESTRINAFVISQQVRRCDADKIIIDDTPKLRTTPQGWRAISDILRGI